MSVPIYPDVSNARTLESPYIPGFRGGERIDIDRTEQQHIARFYEATALRHADDGWRIGETPAVALWRPFLPAPAALRLIGFSRVLQWIDAWPRIRTPRTPITRLKFITETRPFREGLGRGWWTRRIGQEWGVYVGASDVLLAVLARADQSCIELSPPRRPNHALNLMLPFARPGSRR